MLLCCSLTKTKRTQELCIIQGGRLGRLPCALAVAPQPVGRVHSDVARLATSAGPSTRSRRPAAAAGAAGPGARSGPSLRHAATRLAASLDASPTAGAGTAPAAGAGAAASGPAAVGAARVPEPLRRPLLLGSAVIGFLLQHRESPATCHQRLVL